MILGVEPIDLRPLHSAIRVLVELDDIQLGVSDVFGDPGARSAIDRAVTAFRTWVSDNSEREADLRRGLAYALNLDDDPMVALTSKLDLRLPARAADRRRFLTMLWESTFAAPEVANFDPDIETILG